MSSNSFNPVPSVSLVPLSPSGHPAIQPIQTSSPNDPLYVECINFIKSNPNPSDAEVKDILSRAIAGDNYYVFTSLHQYGLLHRVKLTVEEFTGFCTAKIKDRFFRVAI